MIYTLLSDADKVTVREALSAAQDYFYHGTTRSRLASIRTGGLDPVFEHDESEYFWERLEPEQAMRFCTQAELKSAHITAEERARWRDSTDPTTLEAADLVLLRVRAADLLAKSFGLDHAYLDDMTVKRFIGADGLLPADKFIELFTGCGLISCYETLPPEVLEIYTGSFHDDVAAIDLGKFTALT